MRSCVTEESDHNGHMSCVSYSLMFETQHDNFLNYYSVIGFVVWEHFLHD